MGGWLGWVSYNFPSAVLLIFAPSSVYSCLENPRTEEPGRLQSMGSQRVRHN